MDEKEADDEAAEAARAAPRRDEAGRWMPGQTGNPSGRPVIMAGVRELARRYTRLAVRALVDVAIDDHAPPAARVMAARELLDRGHGRPRPAVDLPGLEFASDEELDAMLEFDQGAFEAASALGISRIPDGDLGGRDPVSGGGKADED